SGWCARTRRRRRPWCCRRATTSSTSTSGSPRRSNRWCCADRRSTRCSTFPPGQISFEVYKGSQFEPGDRRPIAEHVPTDGVLVVPEGTYYIVSNYGDANSVVRSDIRVQAGKLTDVTVNHRAAAITLKLVTEKGGEALANTAWSVLTPGGDTIKESIGAFPR